MQSVPLLLLLLGPRWVRGVQPIVTLNTSYQHLDNNISRNVRPSLNARHYIIVVSAVRLNLISLLLAALRSVRFRLGNFYLASWRAIRYIRFWLLSLWSFLRRFLLSRLIVRLDFLMYNMEADKHAMIYIPHPPSWTFWFSLVALGPQRAQCFSPVSEWWAYLVTISSSLDKHLDWFLDLRSLQRLEFIASWLQSNIFQKIRFLQLFTTFLAFSRSIVWRRSSSNFIDTSRAACSCMVSVNKNSI